MNLVEAVRGKLVAQPDVRDVLGYDTNWDSWIFQERLFVMLERSGRPVPTPQELVLLPDTNPRLGARAVAVVLGQRGNWTSPNEHNTMRFPRIVTEFWADPDRLADGSVTDPLSANDKITRAHGIVDRYLHRVDGSATWWPTDPAVTGLDAVRILRSSRLGELDFFPVADGDGLIRAQVFYAFGLG